MKHQPLEPGLLSIFRLLLCIQVGLTVINALAHLHLGQLVGFPFCEMVIDAGGTLALLGYLSWPWLQRRLGRYYLPLALALAIFLSLLVHAETLQSYANPKEYYSNESVWFLFTFLFFPLVLVAWQYSFRAVILYSIFTAVLEILILHLADYAYHDFLFFDVAYQRIIIIRTTVYLVAGYVISRVTSQLRKQRQEMVEANRRLSHYAATLEELAVTQERNRMARELHDTLAHTLSGLAVQLEAARSLWETTPRRAEEIIEEALESTRKGLTETRKSIKALRAGPLDDLGLIQAIRNLAETAASQTGASLNLELPETMEKLPPDVEQCLFRVAQEALANAVKHSEAKKLGVRLSHENGRISLIVMDDGRGFVPERDASRDHFGLKGMQERVAMLGGELEIRSRPEMGTTVGLSLEMER